jgi:hypothetical protein
MKKSLLILLLVSLFIIGYVFWSHIYFSISQSFSDFHLDVNPMNNYTINRVLFGVVLSIIPLFVFLSSRIRPGVWSVVINTFIILFFGVVSVLARIYFINNFFAEINEVGLKNEATINLMNLKIELFALIGIGGGFVISSIVALVNKPK